jgi:hypothetical protein
MPEDIKASEELIDVGETTGAEIDFDDKGDAVKQEEVVEEKIEVEQVPEDKTFENEREVKVETEEKDELKEYSEGVQKRIAKLTRKMREAERQREEAVQYAQSVTQQKNQAENRLSKLDKSYVSEFESRVTTSLAAAKLALKNAIESQDVEAQISAQEQLASLSIENARLNALKVAEQDVAPKQREVNINPQRQQQQQPQQQSDPRAENWASKNSWFGNDSAMTYTAFDIHKKLVEEEGFDPQSNEYYEEVDSRIRLEFPHKFDKVETNTTKRAKPAQAVIAKRLGVPLEDYAKQLNITEGV